jgi:hypothetical protein
MTGRGRARAAPHLRPGLRSEESDTSLFFRINSRIRLTARRSWGLRLRLAPAAVASPNAIGVPGKQEGQLFFRKPLR